MDLRIIFAESLVWSLLWIITVAISVRIFPFTIEHDYPNDVREVAGIQKPSKSQKRNGIIFGIVSFLILFALLTSFIILQYKGEKPDILKIFFHLWIICITWNVVDLLIVDWLFICMLSIKYFVLPRTEDYKGNKNYKFHFVGFLKGLLTMSIIAVIFTLISYLILLFFA